MFQYVVSGVTHHSKKPLFATCGDSCLLWEDERNEPVQKFDWGVDTLSAIKFNPTQTNVLGNG